MARLLPSRESEERRDRYTRKKGTVNQKGKASIWNGLEGGDGQKERKVRETARRIHENERVS